MCIRDSAYSRRCEGAFDISIEPISSLWDFTSGKKQVPSVGEIAQAKDLVDYRDVSVNGQQVRFAQEGMRLELGAIAKGYIADRIRELLESKGIKSAIIDLGGNVVCIGGRPDGSPFRVGIQRPFADRNETVATIELSLIHISLFLCRYSACSMRRNSPRSRSRQAVAGSSFVMPTISSWLWSRSRSRICFSLLAAYFSNKETMCFPVS